MNEEPDDADSTLSETMVARIEINGLGDPARQKQITDAVEALDGVIKLKTEKGALHVSYDRLSTSEKKIEEAIRSTGSSVKATATDTERRAQTCQRLRMSNKRPSRTRGTANTPDWKPIAFHSTTLRSSCNKISNLLILLFCRL